MHLNFIFKFLDFKNNHFLQITQIPGLKIERDYIFNANQVLNFYKTIYYTENHREDTELHREKKKCT